MANVDMLGELQARVSKKLAPTPEGVAAIIDPTAWIPLFTALTGLIDDCVKRRQAKAAGNNKEEKLKAARAEVAAAAKAPTMIQKIATHRALVAELGRAQVKKIGHKFVDAVFSVAAEAKDNEVAALVEEASAR